jgi:nucleoside-diphosphate-sugar epimerase
MHVSTLNRVRDDNPFEFVLCRAGKELVGDIRDESFFSEARNDDVVLSLAADVTKKQSAQAASNLILANCMLPSILGAHYSNSNTHLIHIGTYSHKSDVQDDDPQTFYAATKRAGEQFLKYFASENSLLVTVLHTYDIYGPDQPHKRLIPSIVESLKAAEKIITSPGEQEFRPVFVDDIVRLLVQMSWDDGPSRDKFKELDVYGPELFLVRDMPRAIADALDIELGIGQVERTSSYSGREIMKFNPCHSLPKFQGKWTTLSEGVKQIEKTHR